MNILKLLLAVVFIAACHSSAKMVSVSKQEYEMGKELVAHSDCITCHKVEKRIIGPSFLQVSKKYPPTKSNIEKLADKVITGGSGNWGPIPMTPHNTYDKDDVVAMVKYILSVKNFQ